MGGNTMIRAAWTCLATAAIVAAAALCGLEMLMTYGLIVIVATTVAFCALCFGAGKPWRLVLVGIAGALFWLAQFFPTIVKLALLLVSTAITLCIVIRFWRESEKPMRSARALAVLVMCGVLLPVLSLGYNPYSCLDMAREGNCTEYMFSRRGLMYVHDKNGQVGIRDRWGMILPADYEAVEFMGDPSKPYFKVKSGDKEISGWGIYDIEEQRLLINCVFDDIHPCGQRIWEMSNQDCRLYFISYYSHYKGTRNFYLSEQPIYVPMMRDDLSLRYDTDVSNPGDAGKILAVMMDGLEMYDNGSDDDIADFYWDWADRVETKIMWETAYGSMPNAIESAAEELEMFIDPGLCGTQAEMNSSSYVLAVLENYRMLSANRALAKALDSLDIKKEFKLFTDYMSLVEEWEYRAFMVDEGYWYSCKTLEDNWLARCRFRARKELLQDDLTILNGDTPTSQMSKHTTCDQMVKHYKGLRRKYNGILFGVGMEDEPTILDTICTSYMHWAKFRDTLAADMPEPLASAYRHQTVTLSGELFRLEGLGDKVLNEL